jgi:uncharacterized protein
VSRVAAPQPSGRGPTLLDQDWSNVAFLHWPVSPATVRPFLPAGTSPDMHDGITYVGLIGLRIARTRVGRGPAAPWLGAFLETNVRLYSLDAEGRHGVVFRSLDAERLPSVVGARTAGHLPYKWSRLRYAQDGDIREYRVRRRWPDHRGATSRFAVRVGEPIEQPSPLELFLTARYGLHTGWGPWTMWGPAEHEPWPLHRAELVSLEDQLVTAAGLPAPAESPVSVLWSPGVRSRFGMPRRVRVPGGRPATAGISARPAGT